MNKPCLRSVGLYFVAIAAHSIITTVVGSLIVIGAAADPLQSPQESEESALRQELEQIVKDDPQKGVDARKTLEALDQPASSSQGRQLRNRRERGARRIVNGIQTIRHSAVAAVLRGSDPTTATAWCTGDARCLRQSSHRRPLRRWRSQPQAVPRLLPDPWLLRGNKCHVAQG